MKLDKVFQEMEKYAEKNIVPICGSVKGRFLYFLAKSIKAKRILELGTSIGYSTLWLASAVGKKGKVVTVDIDPHMISMAKKNIQKANFSKSVEIINKDARKVLSELKGNFDLIFVDIIKSQYIEVLEPCTKLLKKGGILVADNAMWDEVKKYNAVVLKSKVLDSTLVPIEDGMMVSIKKA